MSGLGRLCRDRAPSSGRGWFWFSSCRRAFHPASPSNSATLPHPLNTGISFILPLPILSSSCFSMEIYATEFCWIFLFSFHTIFFFFPCIFVCKIMFSARLWVLHLMCKLSFISLFLWDGTSIAFKLSSCGESVRDSYLCSHLTLY